MEKLTNIGQSRKGEVTQSDNKYDIMNNVTDKSLIITWYTEYNMTFTFVEVMFCFSSAL